MTGVPMRVTESLFTLTDLKPKLTLSWSETVQTSSMWKTPVFVLKS